MFLPHTAGRSIRGVTTGEDLPLPLPASPCDVPSSVIAYKRLISCELLTSAGLRRGAATRRDRGPWSTIRYHMRGVLGLGLGGVAFGRLIWGIEPWRLEPDVAGEGSAAADLTTPLESCGMGSRIHDR